MFNKFDFEELTTNPPLKFDAKGPRLVHVISAVLLSLLLLYSVILILGRESTQIRSLMTAIDPIASAAGEYIPSITRMPEDLSNDTREEWASVFRHVLLAGWLSMAGLVLCAIILSLLNLMPSWPIDEKTDLFGHAGLVVSGLVFVAVMAFLMPITSRFAALNTTINVLLNVGTFAFLSIALAGAIAFLNNVIRHAVQTHSRWPRS